MNGVLVSTVGWDTALMSGGASHYAPTSSKEANDQPNIPSHGPSMLDQWSSMHGWTGVGIDIDKSLLPALVVSSLTPGCSAQKCGAIMTGDQVCEPDACRLSAVLSERWWGQIVAIDGRQDLLNVSNADRMLNGR